MDRILKLFPGFPAVFLAAVAPALRAFDATKFAKPWTTTVALMAVNLSLVAVLISSAPRAQAQQIPSLPVCNWCYERMINGKMHHSTKGGAFWRRVEGMEIHHRYDGGYPGACMTAHPWARCCEPKGGKH